jgi:hypothetical protein
MYAMRASLMKIGGLTHKMRDYMNKPFVNTDAAVKITYNNKAIIEDFYKFAFQFKIMNAVCFINPLDSHLFLAHKEAGAFILENPSIEKNSYYIADIKDVSVTWKPIK